MKSWPEVLTLPIDWIYLDYLTLLLLLSMLESHDYCE